jgi:hypothetical protein
MQYAKALMAAAFGACLALAVPAAAADSVRIDSIGTRLFYQQTGGLSDPGALDGGPGDAKFQAAEARPWDGILVDVVLHGPANLEDEVTVVRVHAGNKPDPQGDGQLVAREYLEGITFGPDGVAHLPVLVRGRLYGDVWIDAEIIGADQSHMVRLGFAPRL